MSSPASRTRARLAARHSSPASSNALGANKPVRRRAGNADDPRAVRPQPKRKARRRTGPGNVYLTERFFWILGALIVAYIVAFIWDPMLVPAQLANGALFLALGLDAILLWGTGGAVSATRTVSDRLSMGDENPVDIHLSCGFVFPTTVEILDETPVQFQMRDAGITVKLKGVKRYQYTLRPTQRGVYQFGLLNLFVQSPLGLAERRFRLADEVDVKVYPSIMQMQRYAFLASSNRLEEVGVKRVRRLGHTMEFDQIRTYVPGDDRRSVNWKATARRSSAGTSTLMVNSYQEEREQPVIAALDMGRGMRSPFDGLTLLDHSINAALVLLNTALIKNDRAGLVTFDQEVRTVVRPSRGPTTLPTLLEALYKQDPGYREPSFEGLFSVMRERLRQRSLVLLFTHIDTRAGLERQLPYLRQIARMHRLVVILFENTGTRDLLATPANRLEDVYVKAVAEGIAMETREVARTLERHGIGALLTRPETLTVDAVNRYLQIKAQGAI